MILRESVMLGWRGVGSRTGSREGPEGHRPDRGKETIRAGFAEPDFRQNPERQAGIRQSRPLVRGRA